MWNREDPAGVKINLKTDEKRDFRVENRPNFMLTLRHETDQKNSTVPSSLWPGLKDVTFVITLRPTSTKISQFFDFNNRGSFINT